MVVNVTGRYTSIPVFQRTLCPMDFRTPSVVPDSDRDSITQAKHDEKPVSHYHYTQKDCQINSKQFQFGNSTAQITEDNSQNSSVRDSAILCSYLLLRPITSRNNSVRKSQRRKYRKYFENNEVRSSCHIVCVIWYIGVFALPAGCQEGIACTVGGWSAH